MNFDYLYQLIKFNPGLDLLMIGEFSELQEGITQVLAKCEGKLHIKEAHARFVDRAYEEALLIDYYDIETLTRVYHSLENSGEIIVIVREGDKYQALQNLEECEYRAVSEVDDLYEEFAVLTGKKMHMWGNGM
jgi:hypothetical protein